MTINKATRSIALGGVLAASVAASSVAAAENPFAMASLDKGYMIAAADMSQDGKMQNGKSKEKAKDAVAEADKKPMKDSKMQDGKCGEGKCGAAKR